MQRRNLQIPTGAVFAPMAGLTDAAGRHLMADHGAAWTVSEMASAKALNFGDRKSLEPVSYTHLDVYKRQVLDKGKVIFDGDVDEGIATYLSTRWQTSDFVDYTNPVSYTHLTPTPTKRPL